MHLHINTEVIMDLDELYDILFNHIDEFKLNLSKARGGNKAAAQRARKNSLKLAVYGKMYRKASIEAEKDDRNS